MSATNTATPLFALEPAAEAMPLHGRRCAAHYGDWAGEVARLRSAVGLLDYGHRDRLVVRGGDARDFLQRMLSQDVARLPAHAVAYACLLERKGHVVAPMRVVVLPGASSGGDGSMPAESEWFVLDLPGDLGGVVRETLERFVIVDDVTVTDESATHTALGVVGPRTTELLAALGWPRPSTDRAAATNGDTGLLVVDEPLRDVPGVTVWLPAETLPTVWPRVREAAAALGGGPAGMAAYESVRIAQGLPRWGADWREGLLAKEAGLDAAVSYTKGCYPGQEPTYRLHFRGQPAKRLMRLRLAGGATAAALATLPVPPVPLVTVEGKPAGEVTSLARLPDAETDGAREGEMPVALGFVKRAYVEEKLPLHVGDAAAPLRLRPVDFAGPRPYSPDGKQVLP